MGGGKEVQGDWRAEEKGGRRKETKAIDVLGFHGKGCWSQRCEETNIAKMTNDWGGEESKRSIKIDKQINEWGAYWRKWRSEIEIKRGKEMKARRRRVKENLKVIAW